MELWLQALVKALPDLLFIVDREGVPRDLEGRPLDAGTPEAFVAGNVTALAGPLIGEVQAGGKAARYSCRLEQGGKENDYEARMMPTSGGQVLCVVRDVTYERMLERMALLRERQVALGRLSTSLAHEIRNPVATISGSAQILSEALADEPRAMRQVQRILDQCQRLGRLVDSVLGDVTPRSEPPTSVPLKWLLDEALSLSLIQYGGLAAEVQVHQDARPEGANLLCESSKVLQVLVNLLVNALQAMDGRGQLWLSGERLEKGGARFSVCDNGPGVLAEHRPLLFNLYFSTKPGGSGIGLALCRQLSRSMGGELYYRSPEVGGCEFVLSLPAATAQDVGQERRPQGA